MFLKKKNLLITFDIKSDQPERKHPQKQVIDQSDQPEPQRESRNTPGGPHPPSLHREAEQDDRFRAAPGELGDGPQQETQSAALSAAARTPDGDGTTPGGSSAKRLAS